MYLKEICISNKKLGDDHPPMVVAEVSANHNGSLNRALEIIEKAVVCGADSIKLQTMRPDTITLNCRKKDFLIDDPDSLWCGRYLHDLYEEAVTPWEWHKLLFEKCHDMGIICFSTPFDEEAVDFLADLDAPAYKIGSFENTHIPLIKKVARTQKPVIVSTGMATLKELVELVEIIRNEGNKNIVLLKCTSAYPANAAMANLNTIPHLRSVLNVHVGVSDHSMGATVPIVATALGAVMIEKHFTLSKKDGGIDAEFSMEPDDLAILVEEASKAWHAKGAVSYGPSEDDIKSTVFKRSVYICKTVKAGETLNADNIRIVRPSHGLEPKYYELVLGRQAKCDLEAGTALSWGHLV